MMFRIYFTLPDGSEDFVTVTGETVKEVREKAMREVKKRNGRNPWSQEL